MTNCPILSINGCRFHCVSRDIFLKRIFSEKCYMYVKLSEASTQPREFNINSLLHIEMFTCFSIRKVGHCSPAIIF